MEEAQEIYIAIGLLLGLAVVQRLMYVALFQRVFKLSFEHAPARAFFYFGVWSVLYVVLFFPQTIELFKDVYLMGWLALIFFFFVLFPLVFSYLRGTMGTPKWLFELFPTQTMLTLEERYIIAKSGDVFSQQLVAGIFVLLLTGVGVGYPTIVILFVILFGASHIYLFFTSGFIWGMHYSIVALAGGFAIPFLILFVSGGIVYALIFHMLFYVFSAAFFAKFPRPTAKVCRDILGTEEKELALP